MKLFHCTYKKSPHQSHAQENAPSLNAFDATLPFPNRRPKKTLPNLCAPKHTYTNDVCVSQLFIPTQIH